MNNSSLTKFASVVFLISVVLLGIILAKNILVPLAFSALLAYLLYPLTWRIERIGVHRSFSILIVILITIMIVGAVSFYFAGQISKIQIDLNEIKNKLMEETGSPEENVERKFGINIMPLDYFIDSLVRSLFSGEGSGIGNFFSATATTIFQVFILPVFTFFLLFYRTKTAFFIFRVVGRKWKKKTINILREVSFVTSRYLGGLLGVVAILAVLNTVGLTIIGVPHSLVLGVGAAILNLIPYFGTLLGALIPLFYVLVSMPDPFSMVLKVIIMFVIVQFLENNIITPNIVGGNVKLNALTVILGLLFGNLIWGIAGMLVVIPYIAIIKIIMRNIKSLKPYAHLLSSKGLDNHRIDYLKYPRKIKHKFSNAGKKTNRQNNNFKF